jgi:hypothetical protein
MKIGKKKNDSGMGRYKGPAHMLFLHVNYSEGMPKNVKRKYVTLST